MTGVLEGVTAGGLKGLFKRLAAKQGAPKAPEAENPGGLKPNLQLFGDESDFTKLYRVMSQEEYESLMHNQKFTPYHMAMEEK